MSLDFLKQMHDRSPELTQSKRAGETATTGRIIEGRKFRVDCVYEPQFADIAYEIFESGGSIHKVCKALGIDRKKFDKLREISQEFDSACGAGHHACIERWESIGEENMENKNFNDKIWKQLLISKSETKEASRVILNVDSSSNANQVADLVRELEKAGI